jgi:hypothetical protein
MFVGLGFFYNLAILPEDTLDGQEIHCLGAQNFVVIPSFMTINRAVLCGP